MGKQRERLAVLERAFADSLVANAAYAARHDSLMARIDLLLGRMEQLERWQSKVVGIAVAFSAIATVLIKELMK